MDDGPSGGLLEAPGPQPQSSAEPITTTGFPDCPICDVLWREISATKDFPYRRHKVDLGPIGEALKTKCLRHLPLVEMAWRDAPKIKTRPKTDDDPDVTSTLGDSDKPSVTSSDDSSYGSAEQSVHKTWRLFLSCGAPGTFYATYKYARKRSAVPRFPEWLLLRKPGQQHHPGFARLIDRKWMDTSLVEKWLEKCESCHGGRCQHSYTTISAASASIRPTWVIDVHKGCLVPGKECTEYVTLSYRWGQHKGFRFDEGSVSMLQIPGALHQQAVSSQLSPTVLHALELASRIGQRVRHLWIDNLCVNTANTFECARELQNMSAIYANAMFTIVVFDSDPEEGICGIEGVAAARNIQQPVVNFGDEQFVRGNHEMTRFWSGFDTERPADTYHGRAWTFQEFEMSPRKLVIEKGALSWLCQSSAWHENCHEDRSFLEGMGAERKDVLDGFPNLWSLGVILKQYNARQLTYDEDALPGINGILTSLSQTFGGGFIYGLPQVFFEVGLCWRPDPWSTTPLRRRVHSRRPSASRLHPSELPSWSWIGWHGAFNLGLDEAGPVVLGDVYETSPITSWYAFDTMVTEGSRYRIKSAGTQIGPRLKTIDQPLPPGWTRHPVNENPSPFPASFAKLFVDIIFPEGQEQVVYRHSKMTDFQLPWYWPCPITNLEAVAAVELPDQLRYIGCSTDRAFLRSFRHDCRRHDDHHANLYDKTHKIIGKLFLSNEVQISAFPPEDADRNEPKLVEIIAICRRTRYYRPDDSEPDAHITRAEQLYGVLWVERDEAAQIWHRLAYGEVNKEAWEGLALERIDLVLG